MRKRKRRKNKINIEKPIFKLTREQFEKHKFKDKTGKPVQIGDTLVNNFGDRFVIKYDNLSDEVALSGHCWGCNINAINMLKRIE